MKRIIICSGARDTGSYIVYPEIKIDCDKYYSELKEYLEYSIEKNEDFIVVTYSPIILAILKKIANEENIEFEYEYNGTIKLNCNDAFKNFTSLMKRYTNYIEDDVN